MSEYGTHQRQSYGAMTATPGASSSRVVYALNSPSTPSAKAPRRIPSSHTRISSVGARHPSAYDQFDEQSWLSSLTQGIKNALYGTTGEDAALEQTPHSASKLADLEQWAQERRHESLQSRTSEADERAMLSDGNPPDDDAAAAKQPKEDAAALAAREMLALGGYLQEDGQQDSEALDLQDVLHGVRGSNSQSRENAAIKEAPTLQQAALSASDLFRSGLDISEILRQRAAAQSPSGLAGESEEGEDSDDRDGETDADEDREADQLDADEPHTRRKLIQEIASPSSELGSSDEESKEEEEVRIERG